MATEILNNQATNFALACRVLCDYHPMQPEMTMQLFPQQFPQFQSKGQVRKFIVPVPWEKDALPALVTKYMNCKWRSAGMSLLEWLRKSGGDGQIHQRYRRLHKARKISEPLEIWINRIPAEGEVMVAAITYSRNNDKFYGQWLLLKVPFNTLDDLWDARAAAVPTELKLMTLAYLKRPGYWKKPAKIDEDLEREARPEIVRRNILAMVAARVELIDAYLTGRLSKDNAPSPPLTAAEKLSDKPIRFAPEQQHVIDTVQGRVGLALAAKGFEGPDPQAWADWLEEKPERNIVTAVLGPAGSGKSTAVEVAILLALQEDAHVGIACPTGMLAAAYRSKFPGLDVDTIHGMFALHKPEHETLEMMFPYDMVVIDEIGQVPCSTFERLLPNSNMLTLIRLPECRQEHASTEGRSTN